MGLMVVMGSEMAGSMVEEIGSPVLCLAVKALLTVETYLVMHSLSLCYVHPVQ